MSHPMDQGEKKIVINIHCLRKTKWTCQFHASLYSPTTDSHLFIPSFHICCRWWTRELAFPDKVLTVWPAARSYKRVTLRRSGREAQVCKRKDESRVFPSCRVDRLYFVPKNQFFPFGRPPGVRETRGLKNQRRAWVRIPRPHGVSCVILGKFLRASWRL